MPLAFALLLARPAPGLTPRSSRPRLRTSWPRFIALFVIFVVPVVLIVLFWLVHILPEKIAHKRHHPQFEAIRTLCLLSLVFGGLLWPIAWIWAYSKPVMHKMAYGTDKHHARRRGTRTLDEDATAVASLHERLARLEGAGAGGRAGGPARRPRSAREPSSRATEDAARWKSCCSASTRSSSG